MTATFFFVLTIILQVNDLNLENGLAIQGYDPIAYFESNKAVQGLSEYQAIFDNATYRFASQQHLDQFESNPSYYLPQYGGWCAYAMGNSGEKVKIDPETFKITDGKLYLFYNFSFTNTLKPWNKNETTLRKKADLNWEKITNL